jgi:Zn-dependent protease with chaperone function
MTASTAARSRPAGAPRTLPPWLWVWLLGYLIADMPLMISLLRYTSVTLFGELPGGEGGGLVWVLRLSLIFSMLIYVVILAGAVATMFPHLRGRWVERRFRLASDGRPIMAEMQEWVSAHDPSVSLRVTIRSDQMARVYPVGWRSARIAVFRPLPALWRRDREAAQAILLHEVGHQRHGDQLIVGLGSPFVWLMRIWVPAYLLLVLIPVTVYLAGNGSLLASLIAVTAVSQAVVVPGAVFLPVTALWLAELGADQMAAQALGPDAVRQALQATAGSRASAAARALALLSHPPRRLRLRLTAARPGDTARLAFAWPVAVAVWFVVLPAALGALALVWLGLPSGLTGVAIRAGAHDLLAWSRPLLIATAVALVAWPALAHPWERLCSPASRPSSPRQAWRPYLAAAILPIVLLLGFLAPLQVSPPTAVTTTRQPAGFCGQWQNWEKGPGQKAEEKVDTQFPVAGSSIAAPAGQQLAGEIRIALADPPPGKARPVFTQAMTDFKAALADLRAGNGTAANTASDDGTTQAFHAQSIFLDEGTQCAPAIP